MCSTVAIRPAQLGLIQIETNLLLKNELIVILEKFLRWGRGYLVFTSYGLP